MNREGVIIRLFKNYFFIVIFSTVNLLFAVGCSESHQTTQVEEREGLLFMQGVDELFSGNVVDTVAMKIIEYEVVDGKKNGEFKISSLNGNVEMVGNIKDNLNEGLWQYYYPNGQLESTGNFENNVSVGKWTWFFESGKIREVGYFKEGKKDGNWVIYDEKGNVKRKVVFKEGQKTYDEEFNKELFA